MTSSPKENWIKGMLCLGVFKDAVIPYLEDHYKQTAKEWNDDDNHLKHLLDLAVNQGVKQNKNDMIWDVNCSDCKPILKKIVDSHSRARYLLWKNNDDETLDVPIEHKLAKIYMSGGNTKCQSLRECDPLAILEVCRNDKRIGLCHDDVKYLILFRNRCVHSCDNCLKEEELKDAFNQAKELLRHEKFKQREECRAAINTLDKLMQDHLLCEIDVSNEIWTAAMNLQKTAYKKEGELISEDLMSLLGKAKVELKSEIAEKESLQSRLTNAKSDLKKVQDQLRSREDSINTERKKHKTEELRLQIEIKNLQHNIEEHDPSLAGRIAAGTATGSSVGIVGGLAGVAIGGAAGGVVGAASYFWDKITRN